MIVPQTRLLAWFAVVTLPVSMLDAAYGQGLAMTLLAVGALGILAVVDLMRGRYHLDGIDVQLAEVARFSLNREGAIEVRVRNARQTARRLRLALVWPRALVPDKEEEVVALPAGHEWSRLEWRCTPRKRGRYWLDRACVETASPLGFWAVRATRAVSAELRVYPNLLREQKNLAALFLNRGSFGVHAQRQVGKGREFERLREYLPGDGFDEIHWKATARRGRPVTKVFQIERTQEVYVVIDASRLSAREPVQGSRFKVRGQEPASDENQAGTVPPEGGTSVLERYVTAALVLGLAAERQGDLFGLLTFSDKVERFLRARSGRAHYSACRDALYTLEPRRVTPDFEEMASFIRLRLRRRALLVVLTALDDPALAESFIRAGDLFSRQHLVLVNMMKPPGADPLFHRPDVMSVDDLYERLGGHLRWHALRELEKTLERRGVSFAMLENEELCAQLIGQYLGVKRRQLL